MKQEDLSRGASSSLREELLQLDEQRAAVMRQLEEAVAFLETTPVGLNGPLVDAEGFPRNDCDLYAVRRARQAVNCGKNDLKTIENSMHEKLALLHEENHEEAKKQMERYDELRRKSNADVVGRERRMRLVREMYKKSPFVRVVGVSAGSPGEQAGLAVGDLIVQYGEVDAAAVAACGFGEMARVTSAHENQMLSVWVRRTSGEEGEEATEIFLTPRCWSGDGLLGCEFEFCLNAV